MIPSLADFLDAVPLVCPDDRSALTLAPGKLTCTRCGLSFPVFEDRIVDILASARPALEGELASGYREYVALLTSPFRMDLEPWAWGTRSTHTANEVERRASRVAWIRSVLTSAGETRDLVLCDVSAGAGHYSLASADLFRYVLHCDLVPNAALYAYRKAAELGIHNVMFLRHDYLRSPLSRSADVLICMDTLIRGHAHELALAKSIHEALKPGGVAILDFANLWRQFARRTLKPRQRLSTDTRAYTRRGAAEVLKEAGFAAVQPLRMPGSRLLPQPRVVFRVRRSALADLVGV